MPETLQWPGTLESQQSDSDWPGQQVDSDSLPQPTAESLAEFPSLKQTSGRPVPLSSQTASASEPVQATQWPGTPEKPATEPQKQTFRSFLKLPPATPTPVAAGPRIGPDPNDPQAAGPWSTTLTGIGLQRPFPDKGENIAEQTLNAVMNFPVDMANFGLSPAGVTFAGAIPELKPVIQRLVAAGFTADQIKNAVQAPNWQERLGSLLGAGLTGLGVLKAPSEIFKRRTEFVTVPQSPDAAAELKPAPERAEPAAVPEPPASSTPNSSGMFGPGAAWKGEFQEPRIVTIKNAAVDKQRVDRGWLPLFQPARKAMGKTWDEAMSVIERNEQAGNEMVTDIRSGVKRSASEVDQAVLLYERARVMNERDLEGQRASDVNLDEGSRDEARLRWAHLEDRLNEVDQATQQAGTITGRALQFRQALIRDDYTFAGIERRARASKGRPLTPEESIEIKKQADEISQAEQKATDAQTQKVEAESEKAATEAVEHIKQTAKRLPKPTPTDATYQQIIDAIKERASDGDSATDLTSLIQRLALELVRGGIKEREPLIDAVHGILKDIFPDMERRQTRDAISGYGDFKQLDPEPAKNTLRQLKGEMQQIGKIDDMLQKQAPKKTGIERRTPSDEERRLIKEVNELKKKGGFKITDPAKQLKTALETIKTRLRNQIRDLHTALASRTPLVSTKRTVPLDTQAMSLRQMRDVLKSQYDDVFGKRGISDEQRLKMALNATKKSLEAWEKRLEEFRKNVKEGVTVREPPAARKVATSTELEALKAQRDAMREHVNELYSLMNPGKTALERALQGYKTRTLARIADLQQRIASKDYRPKTKPGRLVMDDEALRLRAQSERLKLDVDRGLAKERLENRTEYQKAMDGISKWRRTFVLSWPTILGKLTSASGWLSGITPIEEIARSGLKLVLPRIAEKAPRYGSGFHLQTEVGAVVHTFKTLFKAAGQKWKTGNSDIDLLYGRPDITPKELKDFVQNLHGALKEPARQNEFFRAFETRLRFAAKNGADITEPLVQTKIGVEAYKEANAQIFMENNMVADFIQRGMSRFRQAEKPTGQPSAFGKAGETFVKYELPVLRIPLNIIKRTFEYSFGTATGTFRLVGAMLKGLDNLQPEQADIIMRNLSRGAVGLAFMSYGFFHPEQFGGYYQRGEKRDEELPPVGGVRVFGLDVPALYVHNPLLAQLQIGATIRRIADLRIKQSDEHPQGYPGAIMSTYGAVIEDVPFVRQAENSLRALDPRQRKRFVGENLKSAVPGVVEWAAQHLDTDEQGNPIKRKPSEILDYPKSGIPILRQDVPEKE